MTHINFSSPRLQIDLIKREHAQNAVAVLQHKELYRYIPQNPPTLEDLENRYSFWENRSSPDGTEYWLNWVILIPSSQQIVGTLQAGIHKERKEASIAYMIGIAFQGKGYGTEAVQALIQHCRIHYGVRVFKAWIDTRNTASIRLVQTLGMEQIEYIEKADHFDGQDSDEFVFQRTYTDL